MESYASCIRNASPSALKASTSVGRRIDCIKDYATQKLLIPILVSWASVPEEASTGVEDPSCTSIGCEDIFTKFLSLLELLYDEDAEVGGRFPQNGRL